MNRVGFSISKLLGGSDNFGELYNIYPHSYHDNVMKFVNSTPIGYWLESCFNKQCIECQTLTKPYPSK
eukprot:scaffold412_cov311-Pavlova_lutheri.AAC.36